LDSDPQFRNTTFRQKVDPPPDPDELIPELPWWIKPLVWIGFIGDPRFSTESEKLDWEIRKRIKQQLGTR
jgi:hypothetical protein